MKSFSVASSILVVISVILAHVSAHADIVCKAQTEMGPAEIRISDDAVTVSGGALTTPAIFNHPESTYDGHMTAMLTAPGLSVSFENWYGCIHNAHVTTSFRDGNSLIESVEISVCRGGSTPDRTCGVK